MSRPIRNSILNVLAIAVMGAAMFTQAIAQNENPNGAGVAGQSQSAELDELLAKANTLYYSYEREGVTGFDCMVTPDWAHTFANANDNRIPLLNLVTMKLHARMDGSSKLEWIDPPNAYDPNGILNPMHSAMDQALTGFLQFWTPFIHGDVIPESTRGIEAHQTADGIVIHSEGSGTKLDEQLDNALNLKHYDVTMTDKVVKFQPSYTPTADGLIVNYFLVHLWPLNATPEQMQEMHVSIDYQEVEGTEVPGELKFDVVGTGTVYAALSNCTVLKK